MCENTRSYLEKIHLCWMIWCIDRHARIHDTRKVEEIVNKIKQLDPTTETNFDLIDFACLLNFINVVNLNDDWHAIQWMRFIIDWVKTNPTPEKQKILTTINRFMDNVLTTSL